MKGKSVFLLALDVVWRKAALVRAVVHDRGVARSLFEAVTLVGETVTAKTVERERFAQDYEFDSWDCGYEMQVVPSLPSEPHDVPLDAIVTEARTLVFSRESR